MPTAVWRPGRYSVRARAFDVADRRQAAASRAELIVRAAKPTGSRSRVRS